jgi:alpha-L-rhamnosidase
MNERVLTQRVLNEYLQSMDQHWSDPAVRGRINAVYPNKDGARDIPDYTQAYLLWVWYYYMETGDREFLEKNYEKFKDIADYIYQYKDENTGLITDLKGGSGAYEYGIVDWPASMRFGYDMTAARTVINGWAYADFEVLAKIAGELNNSNDHNIYQARATDLKAAMNNRLINETEVYVDGLNSEGKRSTHISQHANMFPLALGIVPNDHVSKVIDEVKKQKMSVGMVTLPWLIRAIGEADEGRHLIELYTNKNQLGWARCLSLGATATWEDWDSINTKTSMSHAWGASGLEGYVRYILGIRPLKPQYEEVLIKPLDFGTKLQWAAGTIPTDHGNISVHWKHTQSSYKLQLDLPVNVTARIAIPGGNTDCAAVYLDGTVKKGTMLNNYIVIENIGSGEHTIIRKDKVSAL